MKYIDLTLHDGETIIKRAHLHWIVLFWPAVISAVLIPFTFGISILLFVFYFYLRTLTEIAITNSRVIYKEGWIRRHTEEMTIKKVESIDVDQSVLGRVLGYGKITVRGTGGSFEPLAKISDPIPFKKALSGIVGAPGSGE